MTALSEESDTGPPEKEAPTPEAGAGAMCRAEPSTGDDDLAPSASERKVPSPAGSAESKLQAEGLFLRARRHGLSCFPVIRGDKKPVAAWKQFQTEHPSLSQLRDWDKAGGNIGIVTGRISGVLVLDLDSEAARADAERLGFIDADTPAVKTGKGWHYYYRYPADHTIKNGVGKLGKGIDIRGEGGFVVGAGSVHASGHIYTWLTSPDEVPFAAAPAALLGALQEPKREKPQVSAQKRSSTTANGEFDQLIEDVRAAEEGVRNETLNRAAFRLGQLVAAGRVQREEAENNLREAAQECGLPEEEIDEVLAHAIADGEEAPRDYEPSADDLELDLLAALPLLDYDRARKDAAKRLGIGVGTLDELVKGRRAADAPPAGQGTVLIFEDIEPWGATVHGPDLIAEIDAALKKHVIMPSDDHALAVALWIVHAHLLDHAEHSPRLHITAPTMQCGKSVLLDTVATMVPKPALAEDITTAALFRVIEKFRPTVLIDEVDAFLKDNEEMRGLLNAGHKPNAGVLRCVGEDQEVRLFRVFAATALCGIREIPATIEDRSITIPMRRRTPNDGKVESLRNNRKQLAEIAQRIARWAADNGERLNPEPPLPEELGDRVRDNWRLMIAIADAMGELVGSAARHAVRVLESERDRDDNDAGVMALTDVRVLFGDKHEYLSSQNVVDNLVEMKDRPWPTWARGKPLTQNSLARLLKPFGIRTKQIKRLNLKCYERAPVVEAFSHYCAPKADDELGDAEGVGHVEPRM